MGNAQRGTRSLVLSGLAFSLMTVCVKQLGGRIPVEEIVLARAVISLAITSLALRRLGLSPWGKDKWGLVLRGSAGTVALLCFFLAIAELPLGSATVLQYTYPTFTAAAAALVLKEQLGRLIVVALPLGWLGVVMVVQPGWLGQTGDALPLGPALVGVAGAFCTAIAYVCVRRLSRTEHPHGDYFLLSIDFNPGDTAWGFELRGHANRGRIDLVDRRGTVDADGADLGHRRAAVNARRTGDNDQLHPSVVCSHVGVVMV